MADELRLVDGDVLHANAEFVAFDGGDAINHQETGNGVEAAA